MEAGTPVAPDSISGTSQKKRSVMVASLSIVVILGVLAAIGSQISPSNFPASSAPQATAPAVAATAVTAYELALAYRGGNGLAQKRYGGKTLDVTGTVTGVTLDFMSNPMLQLQGEILPVQAKFDKSYGDKLAAITEGMQVTVRCTSITEVIQSPLLDNCSIP